MGALAPRWTLGALTLLACPLAACDQDAKDDPAPEPVAPEPEVVPDVAPEPPPIERPDEVACTEFVDHMEVVVAQSLGVPVKGLFTEGERRGAIEHCKRYAHPNVVRCGRDTQVLPYLQTCLFFTSLPRPPDEPKPTRERCQAYSDKATEITTVLQTRTMGQSPMPPTTRQQDLDMESCLEDFTVEGVECGIEASSQLALFSCFNPYQTDRPRAVTAEECEVYGDHMMSLVGAYLLAPYPKPAAAVMALQQSGLMAYANPQVQRFQLVNLCHTLDRDLMQCHTEAKTAADLSKCVP